MVKKYNQTKSVVILAFITVLAFGCGSKDNANIAANPTEKKVEVVNAKYTNTKKLLEEKRTAFIAKQKNSASMKYYFFGDMVPLLTKHSFSTEEVYLCSSEKYNVTMPSGSDWKETFWNNGASEYIKKDGTESNDYADAVWKDTKYEANAIESAISNLITALSNGSDLVSYVVCLRISFCKEKYEKNYMNSKEWVDAPTKGANFDLDEFKKIPTSKITALYKDLVETGAELDELILLAKEVGKCHVEANSLGIDPNKVTEDPNKTDKDKEGDKK